MRYEYHTRAGNDREKYFNNLTLAKAEAIKLRKKGKTDIIVVKYDLEYGDMDCFWAFRKNKLVKM
jgi:hypothetical protein